MTVPKCDPKIPYYSETFKAVATVIRVCARRRGIVRDFLVPEWRCVHELTHLKRPVSLDKGQGFVIL
jgi:hypothetical protein